MKKNLTPLLSSLLLGAISILSNLAQAQQMNYQGRLTDTNGNALLDGQYTLTFNLYANATNSGAPVWGPFVCDSNPGNGHAAKADLVSGRFNVILGPLDTAGRTLPPAFTGGASRYLGIRVETGAEIAPRQQILAAPEALHAQIADTVPDSAIGTAQIADGSITAAKINGGTGVWIGNGANIYHDAGNVGIGATDPNLKLQVNGANGARTAIMTDGYIDMMPGNAGNAGFLELFKPGPTRLGYMGWGSGGVGNWNLNLEAGANFMINGGDVGIRLGSGTPAATLDVNGSMRVIGAATTGALQVNGGLKVSGAVSVGALPGHTPIVIEEKTPDEHASWHSYLVYVPTWADRPGGFKIHVYAQHETSYEVRNFDANIVVQQSGYANDPNFPSKTRRISVNWGAQGRTSISLGQILANGNNCSGYQESYPDGWFRITNEYLATNGGCSSVGSYDPGVNYFVVMFHPAVSGQIVISDN